MSSTRKSLSGLPSYDAGRRHSLLKRMNKKSSKGCRTYAGWGMPNPAEDEGVEWRVVEVSVRSNTHGMTPIIEWQVVRDGISKLHNVYHHVEIAKRDNPDKEFVYCRAPKGD